MISTIVLICVTTSGGIRGVTTSLYSINFVRDVSRLLKAKPVNKLLALPIADVVCVEVLLLYAAVEPPETETIVEMGGIDNDPVKSGLRQIEYALISGAPFSPQISSFIFMLACTPKA